MTCWALRRSSLPCAVLVGLLLAASCWSQSDSQSASAPASSSPVCVDSETWWQLVRTLHQLGHSTLTLPADTQQLSTERESCRSSLIAEQTKAQRLETELTALASSQQSSQQTQRQESTTAAAIVAETTDQSSGLDALGISLSEESASLDKATDQAGIEWWWLPVVGLAGFTAGVLTVLIFGK